MRIAIVIPAYNVGAALGRLLDGIRQLPSVRSGEWVPVVVDDGSCDQTGRIARERGAVLLRHAQNLGKGAALHTGFRHALQEGYAGVVTLDGDGQHEPESIPILVETAARERADIVVGDRMGQVGAMPWLRIWTNRITSAWVSRLAGTRITDSQSGFRFIRSEVLRRVPLTCRRYDAESELLIKAGRQGFAIVAAPVRSIYAGGKSHIHPLVDTLRFLRLVGGSARRGKPKESAGTGRGYPGYQR